MNLFINNSMFKCKVCVTPNSIQDGMKNKTFNMNFNGMFFIMPTDDDQSFWMKGCVQSLDIIFISDESIIKIYSDCPPCREQDDSKCPRYDGVGDMILEINGGDCIKYDITKVFLDLFNNLI